MENSVKMPDWMDSPLALVLALIAALLFVWGLGILISWWFGGERRQQGQ